MARSTRNDNRIASRLLAALLIFAVLAVLSLLLPRSLPGELAASQMTPRTGMRHLPADRTADRGGHGRRR